MARYKNIDEYWKIICDIHLLTKHYILTAEELSLDGNTFLQPMKEHRDAYDHIIRVYSAKLGINNTSSSQEYQFGNMDKALGHEFRAFFDTADWLCIILKERLNKLLEGRSRSEIQRCYPDYPEFKKRLLDLPEKITEIREQKDSGKKSKSIYKEIIEYQELLDDLIKDYKKLAYLLD